MMSRTTKSLMVVVCVLTVSSTVWSDTIHVKEGGTGDGSSWGNAYGLLQDALDDADPNDEIWVAVGTYKPTSEHGLGIGDRGKHFRMKNLVAIYGAFPATGDPGWLDRDPNTHETILSGDVGTLDDPNDNCFHVFYHPEEIHLDPNALLDGFTIRDGNADGSGEHNYGGGMYNDNSNPKVTKCIFINNSASTFGGGMYNRSGSPTITDCVFRLNSVVGDLGGGGPYSGGGIFNDQSYPNMTDCIFSANWVEGYLCYGGGMANNESSPTLFGCTFNSNTVVGYYSHGGGIDGYKSNPTLIDCTFTANTADYTGGGMHNEDGSSELSACAFNENSALIGGGMYSDSWNDPLAGNTVTLTDCTFTGNSSASTGGGMYSIYCDSTLTDCTFENNTTIGGIYGGGGICNDRSNSTLYHCTFRGNSTTGGSGGGFYNMQNSEASILDCLFEENSAYYYGCGMYNLGITTVINCTFSSNSGHLYTHSAGGGMSDRGESATIINCTFSENSAGFGGGMHNRDATSVTVVNCTFSGNSAGFDGAGIYNRDCHPVISNCIIWGNIGEQIYNYYSTADPNVTYSCIQGSYPGTGNISSNPMFASSDLRIRDGSPCIDAGDNDALPPDTYDLDEDGNTSEPIPIDLGRGARRADDPGVEPDTGNSGTPGPPVVDMGAYERNTLFVDDDAELNGDGASWATAYRYLQDAMKKTGISEIRVAQGTYKPDQDESGNVIPGDPNETFQMQIAMTIRGGYRGLAGGGDPNDRDPNAFESVLSGDLSSDDDPDDPNSNNENSYHVVTGRSGTDATAVLEGFTITAGNADDVDEQRIGGGMYNNNSSLTVTNCTFSGNSADFLGGGMFNDNNSSPTVTNCTFSDNSAGWGGGMCNRILSSPTVTGCTFTGNSAKYGGGGMTNTQDSSPAVTNCTFTGNSADNWGGGMENSSSNPTVTNCTFSGNSVGLFGNGGGMFNGWVSSPTVMGCTFTGNFAGNDGGGMYNSHGSPTISNCTFSGNSAFNGGGMENGFSTSNLTVSNCTFTGNSAYSNGGGMDNWWESSPTVTGCTFSGNSAYDGGGMANLWDSSPTVSNCTFSGNSAVRGGGMHNRRDSSPTVTNCTFSGNSAYLRGGGMENYYSSSPIVTNCTFAGNTAIYGNGLACDSTDQSYPSAVQMTNCILWDGGSEIWNNDGSTITIIYSDVQGGWPGLGNIDMDPNFVEPGYWDPNDTPSNPNDDFWVNGDYHLISQAGHWNPNSQAWIYDDVTSRCIDAGNPGRLIGAEPNEPSNLRINMGAYGGTAEASKTPMGWGMLADLTNDGIGNLEDYSWQAIDWQQVENEQPGDLNRDGIVDLADLVLLLEDYLLETSWYEP